MAYKCNICKIYFWLHLCSDQGQDPTLSSLPGIDARSLRAQGWRAIVRTSSLSAGELVGVAPDRRGWQGDLLEQPLQPAPALGSGAADVGGQWLLDDPPDGDHPVQGRVGALEEGLHPLAERGEAACR